MKTKDRILHSAYLCIAEKGYANSSLRDIAEKSGVLLSQLHYHFGNKMSLFSAVIKYMNEKQVSDFAEDLNEGIRQGSFNISEYVRVRLEENPDYFAMMIDFFSLSLRITDFQKLMSQLLHDFTDVLENALTKIERIEFDQTKVSFRKIANLYLSTMLGSVIHYSVNRDEAILDSLNFLNQAFI